MAVQVLRHAVGLVVVVIMSSVFTGLGQFQDADGGACHLTLQKSVSVMLVATR